MHVHVPFLSHQDQYRPGLVAVKGWFWESVMTLCSDHFSGNSEWMGTFIATMANDATSVYTYQTSGLRFWTWCESWPYSLNKVLRGIPLSYQFSCTMRKMVISSGSILNHVKEHAVVGSMRSMFTSIYSVWITCQSLRSWKCCISSIF